MQLMFLLSSLANATEVKVEAVDGQRAVVLIDDYVKGETPVVTDVDGGEVTIAFRDSMFGPVLFTQKVVVPDSGTVTFTVDLAERTVEGGAKAATPAPKPAPAPTASGTKLEVTSSKAGLAIVVDGKPTGKNTPATLTVDPGLHVVSLADGCSSGEEQVSVDEGSTKKLNVNLKAAKVMLTVTSEPEGATVKLDGKSLGKTPIDAKISCGTRSIALSLEGYKPATRDVDLGTDDESLSFKLDKDAYGSLEVTVEPEGVIKLDGDRVGANTATIDKVSIGEHVLTIERDGVEVEKRTLKVKENATIMLTLVVPAPDKNAKPTEPAPVSPKPKPTKPTKPAKVKKPHTGPSALRIVGNSAVTLAAVPLGILGGYNYAQAVKAVQVAEAAPDEITQKQIVRSQVRPREILAYSEWGAGGALLITGATLWITSLTDGSSILVLPNGRGITVLGSF